MLAAVILLLCSSCLVRGPEEAILPEKDEGDLRFCAVLPSGSETAKAERAGEGDNRRALQACDDLPVFVPVIASGDRNGLPLGSLTWVRAAYASCPPEGNFG